MSDPIHPRAIEPDDLPAITETLPEPSRNADIIYNLRLLFAQMDDRRSELAKAGDVESLAHGAADVDLLASELNTIKRSAQTDIARIFAETGERKREIPNLGVVEVKGGFDRKNWKSRDVLREVIFRALVDPGHGCRVGSARDRSGDRPDLEQCKVALATRNVAPQGIDQRVDD